MKKYPHLRESLKFNYWVKYFTDSSNKDTYGNATKSAMKAYKTDNYSMAGVIGHNNIKKYKSLSLQFMDTEGYGFAELMKLGFEKVKQGSYKDWDNFMVRLGHFEPEKNITAIQNNFGTAKGITRPISY